jgi:hypothetical protein
MKVKRLTPELTAMIEKMFEASIPAETFRSRARHFFGPGPWSCPEVIHKYTIFLPFQYRDIQSALPVNLSPHSAFMHQSREEI